MSDAKTSAFLYSAFLLLQRYLLRINQHSFVSMWRKYKIFDYWQVCKSLAFENNKPNII